MLLDLAEALNPMLDARAARLENKQATTEEEDAAQTTLQLIFFDGEEAFKDWTNTDSIYGSRYALGLLNSTPELNILFSTLLAFGFPPRHLAEKWSKEFVAHPRTRRAATKLSTIDHLILLDLLGSQTPLIRSYFLSTAWLFDGLVAAEHRLGQLGVFDEPKPQAQPVEGGEWTGWQSFFVPRTGWDLQYGRIADDHIPFLHRGVNILHVIASPFPAVWHTIQVDVQNHYTHYQATLTFSFNLLG
jgi:glutaminyl-peptide cyclotransferase